jgi:glycosyltransferase involved in cell wall biosynthesis
LHAVRSVLRQSVPVDCVCIIADGDDGVLERSLRRLDPERVFVHRMTENRGTYFVRAVARRGIAAEFLAFVDADDRVERRWLEHLLEAARDNDGVAFSGTRRIHSFGPFWRTVKTRSVRPEKAGRVPPQHFAVHCALYRPDRIDAAGGFDPSFRIAYDTAFVNFIALTGSFGVASGPLYVQRKRDVLGRTKSLTADERTGYGSADREKAQIRMTDLYEEAAAILAEDVQEGRRFLQTRRDPSLEQQVRDSVDELRTAFDVWETER